MTAWRRTAGLLGATGVALGAFGTHSLRGHISPERLEIFRTGVLYHLLHAVVIAALAFGSVHGKCVRLAIVFFVAGVFVFSGSLYALALTGVRWLGAITPLGGAAFIAGWIALFVAGGTAAERR